jgi:hypothetical protein
MVNIDFCIWGCRDGFEVIHSENESWKNYLIANSVDLDGKMQKLINSLDEFYMLNKNNGNQVFSFVVPSIDKGFRDTYMVISLISKQDVAFNSKIVDVLHNIWGIYKRDNFIVGDSQTKGKHLTSNEFDISEIKNLIQTINVDFNNKFYQLSNTTVKVDNYDLLKNELGKFKGDSVYLINQNTEQAALNKLPQNSKLLSEILSIGVSLPEIDEFRILLTKRQNFDRARELFKRLQTNVTQQEIIDYSKWSNEISKDLDLKKLIDLVSKHALSEEEKAFIQHHDKNNSPAFLSLTANQIELLRKKITITGEIDITLIEQIKKAIDDAEQTKWIENPKEWEDLLLSKPNIKNKLEIKYTSNLTFWRRKFNEKEEKDTKATLDHWYSKIINSKPKEISKNLEEYKVKITSLSHRILSLQNTDFSEKLTTSPEYIFLTSKEWQPKIWKPNYKLFFSIFCLATVVLVFFWARNWKAENDRIANLDTDRDGVIDANDKEKTIQWLKDTSNYKLKDYVDAKGAIDTLKTKNLCDCWNFPDAKDRKILKCKDNLNWFVFDGKLYEFRSNQPADGKFYKSPSEWVKSGNDDEIEDYHKDKNRSFYSVNGTQDLEATAADQTEMVTIKYKEENHRIRKGFTTEAGLPWGEPDENNDDYIPHWRIRNDKWQKKPTKDAPFKDADPKSDKNMTALWLKKYKPVQRFNPKENETGGNEVEKTETGRKNGSNKGDNNGKKEVNTPADNYWINLDKESEEKIQSKGREIDNAIRNMSPTTPKGIAAKESVLRKRDNY